MKNIIDLFLIFERAFPFASYNDEHFVPISSSSGLILCEKSQCRRNMELDWDTFKLFVHYSKLM